MAGRNARTGVLLKWASPLANSLALFSQTLYCIESLVQLIGLWGEQDDGQFM